MSIRYEFDFPADRTRLIAETRVSRERDPAIDMQPIVEDSLRLPFMAYTLTLQPFEYNRKDPGHVR